ncbi:zinc finger MYND domain-containing protein [Phanerochaete sordida]|uniref:Zinc finger MYND domain-containing protein n=1 Tax=Phanerochaete sordida TaxID=48140 RepID=A0A9P3L9Y9_9APHY|nr:zinc finger MYND domain-containing protein [Phanerochaete sordida]
MSGQHRDDREIRRSLQSCYNEPQCWKTRQECKMQTCSKCKVAIYCSTACQKTNWPVHKRMCSTIQSERDALRTADLEMILQRAATRGPAPTLLPAQLGDEFCDFMRHFHYYLFTGALNCFRVAPGRSDVAGWDTDCFFVILKRRPTGSFPPRTPTWARFRLEVACRREWACVRGYTRELPSYTEFAESRIALLEQVKQQDRDGAVLVIWIAMICYDLNTMIQAPLMKFVSPHVIRNEANVVPGAPDPEEWLMNIVQSFTAAASR